MKLYTYPGFIICLMLVVSPARADTKEYEALIAQMLSMASPDPQFGAACTTLVDKAMANGHQKAGEISLPQLKADLARVKFLTLLPGVTLSYQMNMSSSAACVQQTVGGIPNPMVFLTDISKLLFEGRANLAEDFCLHEALCSLGYGDESYSTSLLISIMAEGKKSVLSDLPAANLKKTKGIATQIASKGGSGSVITGGGDLNSQMLKRSLLMEIKRRSLTDNARKLDYDHILELALDCNFDIVDLKELRSTRTMVDIGGKTMKYGVYPSLYPQLGRMYFYIDKQTYRDLTLDFMKTKSLAKTDLFYDHILGILDRTYKEGYHSCDY